jgi:hypothetical protein
LKNVIVGAVSLVLGLTLSACGEDQRIKDAAEACGLIVEDDGSVIADPTNGDGHCMLTELEVPKADQAQLDGFEQSVTPGVIDVDGIEYGIGQGDWSVVLTIRPS